MHPVQLLEGAHITTPRTRNEQLVGGRLTIGTDDRVTVIDPDEQVRLE